MYGIDSSRSISDNLSVSPIRYAGMRSYTTRFGRRGGPRSNMDSNNLFYNTDAGDKTTLGRSIQLSPRRYSIMRSTAPRFPAKGFLTKYYDEGLEDAHNAEYNVDVAHKMSMSTSLKQRSTKKGSMASSLPRFQKRRPNKTERSLGPGWSAKLDASTSDHRYLSTIGAVMVSPRKYSACFSSRSPRFKNDNFTGGGASGVSYMWPPKSRSPRRGLTAR